MEQKCFLLQDGHVLYDGESYTHADYCFKVRNNGKIELKLALCPQLPTLVADDGTRPQVYSIS